METGSATGRRYQETKQMLRPMFLGEAVTVCNMNVDVVWQMESQLESIHVRLELVFWFAE